MTQTIGLSRRLNVRYKWLFGCQGDMLIFFLPFLFVAAVTFFSSTTGLLLAAISTFIVSDCFPLVGFGHAGATWFHYLDEKNRTHYFGTRRNLIIFVVAPIVILLSSALLMLTPVGWIVFLVYMLWTVQHLTQQNVGILLLYRNQNSGEAVVERKVEARTQQIPATLFLALFFLHNIISPTLFCTLATFVVCFTLALCYVYLRELFQQTANGASLNPPSMLFWLMSVWFFSPIGFMNVNYAQAMLIPLVVHYCQYIGLNYLLVKRKYEGENKANLPIQNACKPVILFVVVCLMFGVFVQYSSLLVISQPWKNMIVGAVLGYALVHYFQDAFIWRFREQFQRESILPFLKPRKQAA